MRWHEEYKLKLKNSDNDANSRLVYSTETGKTCPVCEKPVPLCKCKKKKPSPAPGDGKIRIQRVTKGRKGKGVSVITGIPLEGTPLKELAKTLKIKCGTGGTVKNAAIEIQGDHRDLLIEALGKLGYKAIKAGG